MTVSVWIGDSVTLGEGASDQSKRYSTLVCTTLGWDEVNVASSDAGYAVGVTFSQQIDSAAAKTTPSEVGFVMIMGGLEDRFQDLASMQDTARSTVDKAKTTFPNAMVFAGIGPGCVVSDDETEFAEQGNVLTAIRLGAQDGGAEIIAGMRSICGNDPAYQSSGINPNDAGHAMIATAVESAVDESQGEPLDTPVSVKRRISASNGDWLSSQMAERRRQTRERSEANRPTGTELTQLTDKLSKSDEEQSLQQVIIQQIVKTLQEVVDQLKQVQDNQQTMLETQQDQQEQLKQQQEQLSGVVGQQGSTLASLQSLTARLDTIQNQTLQTIGVNLQTLFTRTDQLLERVQALEDRGSVGA